MANLSSARRLREKAFLWQDEMAHLPSAVTTIACPVFGYHHGMQA